MKSTPLAVAFTRGFWLALVGVAIAGLGAYAKTGDPIYTAEMALGAASVALGGRGLVEGSIDTLRAARAAAGDTSAIQPSDVGAYSPSIAPAPAVAPVVAVATAPDNGSITDLQSVAVVPSSLRTTSVDQRIHE